MDNVTFHMGESEDGQPLPEYGQQSPNDYTEISINVPDIKQVYQPPPPSTANNNKNPPKSSPKSQNTAHRPKRISQRMSKSEIQDDPVDDTYFKNKWWSTPKGSKEKPPPKENGRKVQAAIDSESSGDENTGASSTHLALPTRLMSHRESIISISPADRVRFMLGDPDKDDDDDTPMELHTPFCQMNVLCHFEDGITGWKECARWLKYEEKVEAGDRWSKPHVPTISLHNLFEIRRAIAENKCCVVLDMEATHGCMSQVADDTDIQFNDDPQGNIQKLAEMIADVFKKDKLFTYAQRNAMVEVLMSPHKHKHRKGKKLKGPKTDENQNSLGASIIVEKEEKPSKLRKVFTKIDDREKSALNYTYPGKVNPQALKAHKPNKKLMGKIPGGSEAANILIGQVDFLKEPIMAFVRLHKPAIIGDLNEVSVPTRFLFIVMGPQDSDVDSGVWEFAEIGRSMASLFIDRIFCEVAYKATERQDLVSGIDEYIDDLTVLPPSIWDPSTRLQPPEQTITMDKIKNRLITSARGTNASEAFHLDHNAEEDDGTLTMTGRPFGGLWQDMKRRYPLFLSDIIDGFHPQCFAAVIFLYFACITPIVTFGGLLGIATDNVMGTMETLMAGALCGVIYHLFAGQPLTIVGATGPLLIFESLLYRLCIDNDIDFLSFRFFSGMWTVFILLVFVAFDLSAIVKYITRFTEESFSVLISLIFIYEAFKKQFHILDTHPVNTFYNLNWTVHDCHCELPMHVSMENLTGDSYADLPDMTPVNMGAAAAATTAAYVMGAAVSNTTDMMFDSVTAAVDVDVIYTHISNWTGLFEDCVTSQDRIIVTPRCVSIEDCHTYGWETVGEFCDDPLITDSVPDVFLLSCFLFFGTFGIAMFFRTFRSSSFFPTIIRSTMGDFAVFIAIMICTGVDIAMKLDTPKLKVPSTIETTVPGRGWMVNPMKIQHWYLALLALVPALLATILVFLDQQITAVIVNRKEHKLQKSHGYHLDLFVLAVLIGLCSLLGLPWFVAATVRSITHVRSLLRQSDIQAPGERPQFLGVREQRMTGFFVHILIAVSVFLTSILKYVPMSVLYGVFLYMGITSLGGVQFVDRILILFMPAKYQPDHIYLRHVQTYRIHIFTIIQIICMALMWTVKSISLIAIAFPVMILALGFVRKAMDFGFTQRELYWLDHCLPESTQKDKEDKESSDSLKHEDSDIELDDEQRERIMMKADGVWDKITSHREYGFAHRARGKSQDIIKRYAHDHPGSKQVDFSLNHKRASSASLTEDMKRIAGHNKDQWNSKM